MQPENNSNILLQSLIGYSERVKELLPKIYGKTPKACVNTYGCQQNVSDSEHIKGLERDVEICESPEKMEKLLSQEGLTIDDPVRMYLKDIGKIPLLTP